MKDTIIEFHSNYVTIDNASYLYGDILFTKIGDNQLRLVSKSKPDMILKDIIYMSLQQATNNVYYFDKWDLNSLNLFWDSGTGNNYIDKLVYNFNLMTLNDIDFPILQKQSVTGNTNKFISGILTDYFNITIPIGSADNLFPDLNPVGTDNRKKYDRTFFYEFLNIYNDSKNYAYYYSITPPSTPHITATYVTTGTKLFLVKDYASSLYDEWLATSHTDALNVTAKFTAYIKRCSLLFN
jgi:hypothetical protein